MIKEPIFVVDTNIFSLALKSLYIDVFVEIFEPWSKGMMDECIISVDEVYNELMLFFKSNTRTEQFDWINRHKIAFQDMTNEESKVLLEIFKNHNFREGIKKQNILEGRPSADAILVAKAKCVKGGIIVTAESNTKPDSNRIPNICVSFGVPYLSKKDFYKVLKSNLYKKSDPLEGITVRRTVEL